VPSQYVGLVPSEDKEEYHLVIHDSIASATCFLDKETALYVTVNDSDVIITSSNGVAVMTSTKSMRYALCIVSRRTLPLQTQLGR
jgi:hypothetical protein